jgi:phage-related minor tail protein
MIESQALTTFNKIKDTAVDVGGMLAGTLTDAVVGLAEAFGNLFAGTEAGFKGVVTAALQSIQQIINALLAQAIAGMIAGESKKGLVGLITGAIGISTLLALWKSKVPEFASGTNYAPGGLALVGERGPELVNLPRGAQVYNNNLTRGMMGGGEVRFIIEQDKLVGILSNANKKNIYF